MKKLIVFDLDGTLAESKSSLDAEMRDAAIHHSRLALARTENVLEIPEDLEVVRKLANFASSV
jgi:phosphoglycolate phosphatase-like HAD superfamily hydrolase